MINNVWQIKKAFRESRIAGEENLFSGKITFAQFEEQMLSYEELLRNLGDNL